MGILTKEKRFIIGKNCVSSSYPIGITKEYGQFLIGEINKHIKGHFQNICIIVCTDIFNNDSYFLIKG